MSMKRRAVLLGVGSGLIAGCTEEQIGFAPSDDSHAGGELHGEGQITVEVDDKPVNLSADRFQSEYADDWSLEFHLHAWDDHWYMEGEEPVTVAEGISHLPEFHYEESNAAPIIEIDGDTYDTSDPNVSLTVRINGDEVDPSEYVLEDGDEIEVVVTTVEN